MYFSCQGSACAAPAFGNGPPPNIVLILADDMGWGDVRRTILTPDQDSTYRPARSRRHTIDQCPHAGLRLHANALWVDDRPLRLADLDARRRALRMVSFADSGRADDARLVALANTDTLRGRLGKWHLGLDWTPKPGDPGDWEDGTPMRTGGSSRVISRIDYSQLVRLGPIQLGFDTFFGIADNPGTRFSFKTIAP